MENLHQTEQSTNASSWVSAAQKQVFDGVALKRLRVNFDRTILWRSVSYNATGATQASPTEENVVVDSPLSSTFTDANSLPASPASSFSSSTVNLFIVCFCVPIFKRCLMLG